MNYFYTKGTKSAYELAHGYAILKSRKKRKIFSLEILNRHKTHYFSTNIAQGVFADLSTRTSVFVDKSVDNSFKRGITGAKVAF